MKENTQRSKWSWTFTWWVTTPPGEVKIIPKEEMANYQSEYVTRFTYLVANGWKKEEKKWVSPDNKYKFDSLNAAYQCQKFYDKIIK